MGLVVLDSTSVRQFVKDEIAFMKSVDTQFYALDVNKNGYLSKPELRSSLEELSLLESDCGAPLHKSPEELDAIYDSAFEAFDANHDGQVDIFEFREQLKAILLSIADALGPVPMHMLLDDNSLLRDVANYAEKQV